MKRYSWVFGALLVLTSCTGDFKDINTDLSGITDEMVQKKRNQILDVTQDDIRALADILDSILKTGAFCVIGNEQQIEADHNMFKEVKELFH